MEKESTYFFDTIIVGGGAAGYTAAMYGARYNMRVLLVQQQFGGETALAGTIYNWPGTGADGIDGYELMKKMRQQVEALGVDIRDGEVEVVDNVKHCMKVRVGDDMYQGKTLILAVGMEHRTLQLEREDELKGRGLHYCAACDGPLYKGKRLAIVGGGDSAVKSANQLLDMGVSHVFMIVREPDLSHAEPINLKELQGREDVSYLFENEVTSFLGDTKLEGVTLKQSFDGSHELAVDGVFVHIGAVPRSELPQQLGLTLNSHNQVEVDPRTMHTNVDGVFACGDMTNASGAFKQIVTAAAQAAIAATSAYQDIKEHGGGVVCALHAAVNKHST